MLKNNFYYNIIIHAIIIKYELYDILKIKC